MDSSPIVPPATPGAARALREVDMAAALTALRTAGAQLDAQRQADAQTTETDRSREKAQHERTLTNISQAHAEAMARATEVHREAIQGAADSRDRRAARLAESATEAHEKLETELQSLEEQIREQHRDRLWMAEAVYEGAEGNPRLDYERLRDALRSRVQSMEEVLAETARYVHSCRMLMPPEQSATAEEIANASRNAPTVFTASLGVVQAQSDAVRTLGRVRLFRGPILLPFLMLALALGASAGLLLRSLIDDTVGQFLPEELADGLANWGPPAIGALLGLAVWSAAVAVLYGRAVREMRKVLRPAMRAVALCRAALDEAMRMAAVVRKADERSLAEARESETCSADQRFNPMLAQVQTIGAEREAKLKDRIEQKRCSISADHARKSREAEIALAAQRGLADRNRDEGLAEEQARHAASVTQAERDHHDRLTKYQHAWSGSRDQAAADLGALSGAGAACFPAWANPSWEKWLPTPDAPRAARVGVLNVSAASLPGCVPTEPALAWGGGAPTWELPLALTPPSHGSLLVECGHEGRDAAIGLLQETMMRLLVGIPPGKVRFTIIDPVGLGQGFAAFMHLADEMESLVGERIWTEPRLIEQRLSDLTEHMETVIQKYLRSEFASIDAYNEKAGEIAEPYRFLVLCDFPVNVTEIAAKRLVSIIESGARCGVWTLILRDTRQELPPGIRAEDLRGGALQLHWKDGRFCVADEELSQWPFTPGVPSESTQTISLLKRIGKAAREAGKVEVPFAVIAPPEGKLWSESSARSMRVPLGRAGAVKLQSMLLGEGTSQHALIAGKTGSGKSTLLHALITNLALWYSPDEVEFYLVDFKKGVEFKTYATHRLPHARAVAVESDREFGLSVLHGLDAELRRRGEIYRDLGVQDLAGYRSAAPGKPMPRVLLIIDEFQELFTEDDRVGQDAALLLDRLVRQGRAFGMHVVLGSQTLGGAFSLPRTTMGQMAIRIALQCNEADSQLILSDENVAARLLSRPGEAIYNDAGGQVEGNSPFQVVWLPEAVRETWLTKVTERSAKLPDSARRGMVVFEGNAPADLAANRVLNGELPRTAAAPRIWLGEAIAIKDPTAAVLGRQSGANLVVVGHREEAAHGIAAAGIVSLAMDCAATGGTLVLLDGTPPGELGHGTLGTLAEQLGLPCQSPSSRDLPEALARIGAEVARRDAEGVADASPIFLLIHQIHRFRSLRRNEDDFSMSASEGPPAPDKLLAAIVRDGPTLGVHTIVTVDTATNLARAFDRGAMREFDQRVLFQVSATDSSTLIDSPNAARLGPQRALLHNEEHGTQEKFRPYAFPEKEFVAQVAARLDSLRATAKR